MPASTRARTPDGTFVIKRIFDAPPKLVWAAWSDAAQMQSWWGPKGCVIDIATFEFRPGGFFHYAMNFPEGASMWGRFLFRSIDTGKRIVWLNSFSNEGCGITRAPFDVAIPLEILNDVTFEGMAGKTTLTLRAHPHGATSAEAEAFAAMHASLNEGYGGTLDRLAAALGTA